MSNYLMQLAMRSMGMLEFISPRTYNIFEPFQENDSSAQESLPLAETIANQIWKEGGLESETENEVKIRRHLKYKRAEFNSLRSDRSLIAGSQPCSAFSSQPGRIPSRISKGISSRISSPIAPSILRKEPDIKTDGQSAQNTMGQSRTKTPFSLSIKPSIFPIELISGEISEMKEINLFGQNDYENISRKSVSPSGTEMERYLDEGQQFSMERSAPVCDDRIDRGVHRKGMANGKCREERLSQTDELRPEVSSNIGAHKINGAVRRTDGTENISKSGIPISSDLKHDKLQYSKLKNDVLQDDVLNDHVLNDQELQDDDSCCDLYHNPRNPGDINQQAPQNGPLHGLTKPPRSSAVKKILLPTVAARMRDDRDLSLTGSEGQIDFLPVSSEALLPSQAGEKEHYSFHSNEPHEGRQGVSRGQNDMDPYIEPHGYLRELQYYPGPQILKNDLLKNDVLQDDSCCDLYHNPRNPGDINQQAPQNGPLHGLTKPPRSSAVKKILLPTVAARMRDDKDASLTGSKGQIDFQPVSSEALLPSQAGEKEHYSFHGSEPHEGRLGVSRGQNGMDPYIEPHGYLRELQYYPDPQNDNLCSNAPNLKPALNCSSNDKVLAVPAFPAQIDGNLQSSGSSANLNAENADRQKEIAGIKIKENKADIVMEGLLDASGLASSSSESPSLQLTAESSEGRHIDAVREKVHSHSGSSKPFLPEQSAKKAIFLFDSYKGAILNQGYAKSDQTEHKISPDRALSSPQAIKKRISGKQKRYVREVDLAAAKSVSLADDLALNLINEHELSLTDNHKAGNFPRADDLWMDEPVEKPGDGFQNDNNDDIRMANIRMKKPEFSIQRKKAGSPRPLPPRALLSYNRISSKLSYSINAEQIPAGGNHDVPFQRNSGSKISDPINAAASIALIDVAARRQVESCSTQKADHLTSNLLIKDAMIKDRSFDGQERGEIGDRQEILMARDRKERVETERVETGRAETRNGQKKAELWDQEKRTERQLSSPEGDEPENRIRVIIGRIDVRTNSQPSAREKSGGAKPADHSHGRLSLDDYLKQRNEGNL